MKPQSAYFNLQCVVLGACLLESSAFQRIDGVITPTHLQPGFNKVFATMQTLYHATKPITIIDVAKAMSNGMDENKRNFATMAHMMQHVCSTAYLEHHALSLVDTYWCNTAKAAVPNIKTIQNLNLAQDIQEISESINNPECDVLDVLPHAAKKLEVFYPNDLHVVKALLQVASNMSEDVFRIKESLTQKGWYGAAKLPSVKPEVPTLPETSEQFYLDKNNMQSTINEDKIKPFNRNRPTEKQNNMPF